MKARKQVFNIYRAGGSWPPGGFSTEPRYVGTVKAKNPSLALEQFANGSELDDEFLEFHVRNPQVYETLVRLARAANTRNRQRARQGIQQKTVSMKMLWEVVRFDLFMSADADRDCGLNNSLHSRYARMIMANEPDLAGLFQTRRLKS